MKRALPDQYEIIPIEKLKKAPWNYKRNDEERSRKLEANLRRNGQIINLNVRSLKDGFYEVIDGNHRLEALKAIGQKKVIAFNHGTLTEAEAKRIAVEINETQFLNDSVALEAILEELSYSYDDLLETCCVDINDLGLPEDYFDDGAVAGATRNEDEASITFVFTIEQHEVVTSRIKERSKLWLTERIVELCRRAEDA